MFLLFHHPLPAFISLQSSWNYLLIVHILHHMQMGTSGSEINRDDGGASFSDDQKFFVLSKVHLSFKLLQGT